MILDDIEYWHFDAPTLYTVKVSLKKDGELLDQKEKVVGFRDFHIQGRRFFLNGEPVRVCGTEWMPGSDPMYGMAETKEQLEKMLRCLKGTNCVFTRSHWQQDDWVFDWCGSDMEWMIQEEVPFWGSGTAESRGTAASYLQTADWGNDKSSQTSPFHYCLGCRK